MSEKTNINYVCIDDFLPLNPTICMDICYLIHMNRQICFSFDAQKGIETLLYIAHKAGGRVDKYKLLKTIYYSDKFHLNKYGRFVIGGQYLAIEFGPVLSEEYSLLKDSTAETITKDKKYPFAIAHDSRGKPNVVNALRKPDMNCFSKSDIEAIEYGWEKCKNKSFDQLKKMTHHENAWRKAWVKRGAKKGAFICTADMIRKSMQTKDSLIAMKYAPYAKPV